MTDAVAIYQDYLDAATALTWTRDYEAVCDLMAFPHPIRTLDAEIHEVGRSEMLMTLAAFRDSLERLGAQGYHRLCLAAQVDPLDADRIAGRHRTYILRGGSYVVDPFESELAMQRVDGAWKAAGLRSSVRNTQLSVIAPALPWQAVRDEGGTT